MARLLSLFLLFTTFLLGACGGGGGFPGNCHGSDEVCFGVTPVTPGGTPSGTDSLTGTYTGTTTSGRAVYAVVEDDNTLWLLYSAAGASLSLAGAQEGAVSATSGTVTVADLLDLTTASTVGHGTLNGTYTLRSALAGTTTFATTANFTTTYDTGSDTRATFTDITGTYGGVAIFAGASETATVRVDASGAISGQMASGCNFQGSAVPEQRVRAYTVALLFQGGACANGTSTVTGVAIVHGSTLMFATVNGSRANGLVFSGARQ